MPENPAPVSRIAEFQIVYDGPALESGAMDVRDLAPALLALSSLIDTINARVNGSDKPVAMKFKSTRQGSLIAELQLTTTWIQDVVGMFTSIEGQNLKLIMDTLWGGGVAGGAGLIIKGVFAVIKHLKGAPPAKVEAGPGNTIIVYNITNNQITTNLGVLELSQDSRIKTEAGKVVRPLEKEGIESFSIYHEGGELDAAITKQDLPAFLPDKADQPAEDVSVVILQLVHPDLTDSNAKWRFTDGNSRFNASVTDESFLAQFKGRVIKTGYNDAMRVELVRRQRVGENQKLQTDYEVRRVLNYYDGGVPPVQGKLELS